MSNTNNNDSTNNSTNDGGHDREPGTEHVGGPGSGCSSASAVAGLAREIEGLRARIGDLVELPGVVSELGGMVAELAEELTAFSARPGRSGTPAWLDLAATLSAPEPEPDGDTTADGDAEPDGSDEVVDPAPRVDTEAARVLLDELCSWVGRVYLRYADAVREFPECWLWHPDVVEELLWLWQAWQQAYLGDGASVLAAGDWHDRYRPGVVRRIKDTTGSCSLERHTGTDPDPGAGEAPVSGAAGRIVTWWTADPGNRAGSGCPVPSRADGEAAARYWATTGGRR